jgi:transcriptional repressor NrdR
MNCNVCNTPDTKVLESRECAGGKSIRRRRMCLKCEARFTTYERIERPQLVVIKSNDVRELFDRNKLMTGFYKACEKTPVTSLQIEQAVSDVETQLYSLNETEVQSTAIGEIVMEQLASLNEVAYVRFASVYRRFTDLKGFEQELSDIKKKKNISDVNL